MARDNYYRVLLYVAIALLFAQFFVVAWFIGTHSLPWWAFLALTLGTGFSSSGSLLIGHELGHKSSRADRVAAQVVNGLVGYGHFCIEHNRGHHVHVATPEDCVSSRMGESIYKFVLREIPGAFRRGWALERERLEKLGKSVWSLSNEILMSWLLTAVIAAALVATFGWIMVPFLVIHHFYAWYGLTQANYVEHYGLLRQKLAERPLRAAGAAPFLEHEPHLLEPDLVPPAAPLRSSRQRAAALPGAARLRRPAAPAERLSGQLRPRDDSAAVVQGDGSEADGMGRRRHHAR